MSAIPVVLVHGFMASPLLLRPMKRQLERQGFVVSLVSQDDCSPDRVALRRMNVAIWSLEPKAHS